MCGLPQKKQPGTGGTLQVNTTHFKQHSSVSWSYVCHEKVINEKHFSDSCMFHIAGWPAMCHKTAIDEKHYADSICMFYIAGWLALCHETAIDEKHFADSICMFYIASGWPCVMKQL